MLFPKNKEHISAWGIGLEYVLYYDSVIMNFKTKIISFTVLFVLIAIGAGFYLWQDWQNTQNTQNSQNSEEFPEGLPRGNLPEEAPRDDAGSESETNNQSQSDDSGIKLLNKLTQNFPKGTDQKIISQIKELSQTLKDNNDYYDGWLQLGILRKNIGDLEGAAEAWQYAIIIRPDNSIAYLNLGDLYGYYFHDNQKAEANLLKAIKVEPANIYAYSKTYEFYIDTNQPEKASKIVEQGIAANPNTSQSLQSLLNL